MKSFGLFLSTLILLSLTSCELFDLDGDGNGSGLSTDQIIEGLKTALEIGADSSTAKLAAVDGYFQDEVVKILLPPEADIIYDNLETLERVSPDISDLIGGELEKLVKSINRSAEDAAKGALPIFSKAITDLDITDGLEILNGSVPGSLKSASESSFDSLAATHYLEQQTKGDLIVIFSAPIDNALNKKLVSGLDISANQIWTSVTGTYNDAVELYNLIPFIADLNTVNDSDEYLGEFVTERALTGLFLKVGEEEKKIRKNPFAWAEQIIQDVFGYIQDQFEG